MTSDHEIKSLSFTLETSMLNNTNNTTTNNTNTNNGFKFGIAVNNIGAAQWIKLIINKNHIADCCSHDDGNRHRILLL